MVENARDLKRLRAISKSLAEMKEKIIWDSWHDFFQKIFDVITEHKELSKLLYKTQEELYNENHTYREMSAKEL